MNASLNLDIIQHCQTILDCEAKARHSRQFLFEENKELFCNRILKVCEQKIRGHKEPTSCCGDYAIEFGIVKNGLKGLLEEEYPSSCISFEVTDHFSDSRVLTFIEANIEASSRSEIDGNITIMFPVNNTEFDSYIARLKDGADKREEKAKKDIEENLKSIEEKEKEQLKILKEKYETAG